MTRPAYALAVIKKAEHDLLQRCAVNNIDTTQTGMLYTA